MNRGFKMTSPLKFEKGGPGDKNASEKANTTTTKRPGQYGGIEGTIVSKTTIKEGAKGSTVALEPAKKWEKEKTTARNLEAYKKMTPAQKAIADKKERAKNKVKKANFEKANPAKTTTTASASSRSTEDAFEPTKEEAKPGDRIDNFTPEERRMQGREGKVAKRQEKEEGAQNTRRTGRYGKQEAKNMGMSGKEARQVKKDIKAGRTNANVTKALGGEENAKLARSEYEKSKWQGPVNKAGKKLSLENPDQAAAVKGQGAKGQSSNAASGASTGTEYTEGSLLQGKKEGGDKKITEATKNLEVAKPGKSSASEEKSAEVTTTSGNKYDFSAEGNKIPESFKDTKTPTKMRSSVLKFVMKGFGSKLGKK